MVKMMDKNRPRVLFPWLAALCTPISIPFKYLFSQSAEAFKVMIMSDIESPFWVSQVGFFPQFKFMSFVITKLSSSCTFRMARLATPCQKYAVLFGTGWATLPRSMNISQDITVNTVLKHAVIIPQGIGYV